MKNINFFGGWVKSRHSPESRPPGCRARMPLPPGTGPPGAQNWAPGAGSGAPPRAAPGRPKIGPPGPLPGPPPGGGQKEPNLGAFWPHPGGVPRAPAGERGLGAKFRPQGLSPPGPARVLTSQPSEINSLLAKYFGPVMFLPPHNAPKHLSSKIIV